MKESSWLFQIIFSSLSWLIVLGSGLRIPTMGIGYCPTVHCNDDDDGIQPGALELVLPPPGLRQLRLDLVQHSSRWLATRIFTNLPFLAFHFSCFRFMWHFYKFPISLLSTWRANAVGAWTFGTDWKMRGRSTSRLLFFPRKDLCEMRFTFMGGQQIDFGSPQFSNIQFALFMKSTAYSELWPWLPSLSPCKLLASSVSPAPLRGLGGRMQWPWRKVKIKYKSVNCELWGRNKFVKTPYLETVQWVSALLRKGPL